MLTARSNVCSYLRCSVFPPGPAHFSSSSFWIRLPALSFPPPSRVPFPGAAHPRPALYARPARPAGPRGVFCKETNFSTPPGRGGGVARGSRGPDVTDYSLDRPRKKSREASPRDNLAPALGAFHLAHEFPGQRGRLSVPFRGADQFVPVAHFVFQPGSSFPFHVRASREALYPSRLVRNASRWRET